MFSSLSADTDKNRKLTALGSKKGASLHPYFLARALFTPEQRDSLLMPVDQGALTRANAPLEEDLRRAGAFDPVNRVSYLEARCYMLNTLLRDSDVMSMAHGLELRVPLVDHQLADKLLQLPGAWKLDSEVPKPLLVGALKGALPNEIVHRKKQGFTLPFERWLRENLRAEMEAALPKIGQGPLGSLLDYDAVAQVWDDFMSQADFMVAHLVAACAGAVVRAEFGVGINRHRPRGDSRPRLSSGARLRVVLALGKNDVELRSTGQPRAAVATWSIGGHPACIPHDVIWSQPSNSDAEIRRSPGDPGSCFASCPFP